MKGFETLCLFEGLYGCALFHFTCQGRQCDENT